MDWVDNEQGSPAPPEAPANEIGEVVISQWEFLRQAPTRDQVLDLLDTLPKVWGVATVDFADYVQALPQKKKIQVPHPERPNLMVDEYLESWTIYMGVAGRLKMLERAQEINAWTTVDFEPEPVTPTGIPGWLSIEPRLVYREYLVIYGEHKVRLGRKPGTAWVPYTDGKQAAGSNPFEKVETSARGRALGAWGFGVLPGSGIASVEEMQAIRGNAAYMQAEAEAGGGRVIGGGRKSRDVLLEETRGMVEQLRQAAGQSDEEVRLDVVAVLQKIGVTGNLLPEGSDGEIDWSKVKDGQLQLLIGRAQEQIRRLVGRLEPPS